MHPEDNGYDKDGHKVNDKGGDTTDYMYDEKGNIISSTSVEFKGAIPSSGEVRGYGFKGFAMATGGIEVDNSLFEIYAGGKVIGAGLNYLGKGLSATSSFLSSRSASFILKNSRYLNNNNWIRLGKGQLNNNHYMRLSIGAGEKAFNNMSSGVMKNINGWLRNNIGQEGHFYFKNWK